MASPYQPSGPIDCSASIDASKVRNKTAIVTGGAVGIGEAYVRALVAAGAYVVVADVNESAGNRLQQEFSPYVTFAKCDVTSWTSQLSTFKKTIAVSPTSQIDIVVANAGISTPDPIFFNDIGRNEPEKPKLAITDVNVSGVLMTTKLALWYFRKQNAGRAKRDQCLVLQGSVLGYVEVYGAPQYATSKFAVRGLMRSLRRSEQAHGIRVNVIAPWYVKTPMITNSLSEAVTQTGAGFAALADAGQALLRIVSDDRIHGRSIAVMPGTWPGAEDGFVDLDQDDFDEQQNPWMYAMQETVVKPAAWIQSQQGTTANVY